MPSRPPNIRWMTFRNDSGEEVPAFAVIRITGVSDDGAMGPVLTADQPDDSTESYSYYINGPVPVAIDTYGKCTEAMAPTMALGVEEDELEFGDEVGPSEDTWTLTAEGTGFNYLGEGFNGDTIYVTKQSGGGTCTQNEVQIINVTGRPTGGSFVLTVSVNSVSSGITIPYSATSAQVQTAFEGHAEIASGDVTCTGGALPSNSVSVTFTGDLANTEIQPFLVQSGGLTGGSGPQVIITRFAKGMPS